MSLVVTVRDAAEMEQLGDAVGSHLNPGDAVCLVGPLGAGKTTLTRGIAQGLGITHGIASPTFVISRRHRGPRVDLVHCDAYRLAADDEFLDVVADPEDVVTVVEWGEHVMAAVADSWLEIRIDRPAGGSTAANPAAEQRTVTFQPRGTAWDHRDVASWLAARAAGDERR